MPVTVRAPLWVSAPPVVTPRVPETVEAPRIRALVSVNATLFPLVMPTVLKLLALSRVMLLAAPAASVVVPVTISAPLSGDRPVGGDVQGPRHRRGAQVDGIGVHQRHVVAAGDRTGVKLLALSRVMLLAAPAARVVVPGRPAPAVGDRPAR